MLQHVPVRLRARAALEQGRLDKSVTSQLSVLTDEEYRQGVDRVREAVESAEGRGESLSLSADLRLYATFGAVPSRVKETGCVEPAAAPDGRFELGAAANEPPRLKCCR